jgi:hypothetical protein
MASAEPWYYFGVSYVKHTAGGFLQVLGCHAIWASKRFGHVVGNIGIVLRLSHHPE